MKKIVFTLTNDITYDQRMDRISTALVEAGYDVTIIGFLKKRSVKTLDKPYHQVRFKFKNKHCDTEISLFTNKESFR